MKVKLPGPTQFPPLMIIALLYLLSISCYGALAVHTHLPTVQECLTMSTLNVDIMKQLLADQSRTILSEIKSHVQAEVSAQLGPHAARVDQLHDDQILIKKQLSDITAILKNPAPSPSTPIPPSANYLPSTTSVFPATGQPHHNLSQPDQEAITAARHKLHFSPITSEDLERLKSNPSENITAEDLIKRALYDYFDENMNIPAAVIRKIEIKQVEHGHDINFDTVTASFSSISSVNTIFKYVKNLEPQQRVSIAVPPVLEPKYDEFKSWSFHLRNVEPKHKTVIKYMGNDLVLYAKRVGSHSWFLVNSPPSTSTPTYNLDVTHKRPRDVETATFVPDPSKKLKKTVVENPPQPQAKDQPDPKPTGIPRPNFTPVPCHSQPPPLDTNSGAFWPDVTRSPSTRTSQQLGNYQAQTKS